MYCCLNTKCSPGHNHNGFMVTDALEHESPILKFPLLFFQQKKKNEKIRWRIK